jgi:hypothetical protein
VRILRPQFPGDDDPEEEQRCYFSIMLPDHNMAYLIGVAENEGHVVTVREFLTIDSKGDQGRSAHGPVASCFAVTMLSTQIMQSHPRPRMDLTFLIPLFMWV